MRDVGRRWELVDGGVTFVDDLVLRPAQPWTPTIHDLLRHLRDQGLDAVPEPVDLRDGVEVLRYLPGDCGEAAWRHAATDDGLRSAAALLRRIHDVTETYRPPDDSEWAFQAVPGAVVVTHGDPGPWNFVWRDGVAVGLIDWDLAVPAPALDDVAYALETFVPFRSDDDACGQPGFAAQPDRAARLRAFAEAYRLGGTAGLVDRVIDRQLATIDRVAELAERGFEPWAGRVRDGHLDELRRHVRWTREHRHLWST